MLLILSHFCSKLFKKAQLEAINSDITQPAYEEIISGIQDIDDPNNFFCGLAKLNKDLNSSGERYFITSEDLVKINKAYIIDTSDLLTIGQRKIVASESDSHISASVDKAAIPKSRSLHSNISKSQNVPLKNTPLGLEANVPINDTIFAKKYTYMIRCVHFLFEKTKENPSNEIKEYFYNLKDLETATLLLKSVPDESAKEILETLLNFMIIIPSDVNEKFIKLFPFVSPFIGALQFLLTCLETNMLLDFNFEEKTGTLVEQFCKLFVQWIDERLDELNKSKIKPNNEQKPKLKEICPECQGFYFVFEE